ncbi:hypothetical protein Dda_6888 [Drechslerella dactyloides]|uniref:FAD dependent oxidoreductase domain-containing protein n=1 Tax=Drechslerella dactyloides TaxID=74499 RepID=A0AAD6NHU0_DREDA|nr:hypothetical protein Dda_6888 [Drechslerella dactyloides]
MPQKIVVVGGGIIGVSTAYFLSRHPANPSVTLIEASSIACGASGKAGGLLALDWHGVETASLARLSYNLHASLADQHNGRERWGYRELNTLEVSCEEVSQANQNKSSNIPSWLRGHAIRKVRNIGSPKTTAQVHPRLFCEAMVQESKNLKIIRGYVTKILGSAENPSTGVEVETDGVISVLEAEVVVVAAGPWTTKLLPSIPVSSQRAHSITIGTTNPVSPYALFTSIKMRSGNVVTPEIYPRQHEIYACGDIDKLVPLPKLAKDVQVDQERCKEIVKNISALSELLEQGEVTAMQAPEQSLEDPKTPGAVMEDSQNVAGDPVEE